MNPHSHENEIQFIWGCGAALAGALLGAMGLTAGIDLYYLLTDPEVRRDGQYAMFAMYSVPLGGVLGGAVGFVLPYVARRKRA